MVCGDNVDAIVGARRLPWLIKGKETKYVEHKGRTNALSPPSYREKRRKTTVPISGTVPTVNAAPMVMNTKALLELTTLCQKMRERETAASRQRLYNDTIDCLITLAVTDPNSTRLLRRLGTLLGYAYTGIHDIEDIDDLGKNNLRDFETVHLLTNVIAEYLDGPLKQICTQLMQDLMVDSGASATKSGRLVETVLVWINHGLKGIDHVIACRRPIDPFVIPSLFGCLGFSRTLILSDLFFLCMFLCTLFSSECHGQGRDQN